uniref:Uncharacterized protein n=1 Tax=viral metagenome TaxID=1070528 RepID=A0A6C0HNF6_9ZZZZ
MSAIKLSNKSDIGSIINAQEIPNTKEKKTIKTRTRIKPALVQDTDVRKDMVSLNVVISVVAEDHPAVALVKKPRKSRVSKDINKIDTPPLNSDSEETQNISFKRKRGRPPKYKNEITKSHWLGFFAFVAENGYFEVSK